MLVWLQGADHFLKTIESDVTHVLLSSRLDKAGNLEVDAAALFATGSSFALAGAKTQSAPGQPLAGLPDVPYVFAFSGSMSGSLMKEMVSLGTKAMTAMAKDMPAEKLQKLEQAGGNIFKDLKSMSMVVGAGNGKESLFQNSYVVMKVANAQAYLQNYEDYFVAYNSLMKEIKLPEGIPNQAMNAKKTKVDGLAALEVTADPGNNANQTELIKKLMEVYVGPGGKMIGTTVAVDNNTLLMRYTPATEIKGFLKSFKDQSVGLAMNKDIAQTTKLLPSGSQWTFFISPQGSVALVHRIMTAMMPELADAMHLPEFPQTPPIGVGIKLSATGLEKRLVIPAAVLDGVASFLLESGAAKRAAGAAPSP